MEIKNSNFVITGANRGIGRAVALELAADKPHFHLVMRTLDKTLVDELIQLGASSVTLYETDLAQPGQIKELLEKLKNIDIDILFNNAGLLTGGLLENQDLVEIFTMLQVNVNALIHLTHDLLPRMLEKKRGKIINHCSVSSIMALPCASTYSAAKAAVYSFTKCLELELKGSGVTTLALITPGVDTRMYRDIPKLYGKNFDLDFVTSMPPRHYARMIREAILEDLAELKPSGMAGLGLLLARYTPNLFNKFVGKKFRR